MVQSWISLSLEMRIGRLRLCMGCWTTWTRLMLTRRFVMLLSFMAYTVHESTLLEVQLFSTQLVTDFSLRGCLSQSGNTPLLTALNLHYPALTLADKTQDRLHHRSKRSHSFDPGLPCLHWYVGFSITIYDLSSFPSLILTFFRRPQFPRTLTGH